MLAWKASIGDLLSTSHGRGQVGRLDGRYVAVNGGHFDQFGVLGHVDGRADGRGEASEPVLAGTNGSGAERTSLARRSISAEAQRSRSNERDGSPDPSRKTTSLDSRRPARC